MSVAALLAAELVGATPPNENPMTLHDLERAVSGEPKGTRVRISQGRPTFPCSCGTEIGPNEGRQVFKANVKKYGPGGPPPSGAHVYTFTCPNCGEGHIVESAHVLQVATPPVGEARNEPCPCASGKKAKRCHPGGYVSLG